MGRNIPQSTGWPRGGFRMPLKPAGWQTERIGIRKSPLWSEKRSIEESVERESASAERRLSAELLQHKLLDRIIEEPPTGAECWSCLRFPDSTKSRSAEQRLCSTSASGRWVRPRLPAPPGRPAVMEEQSVLSVSSIAWIDRAHLPGPESLHVLADVGNRGVEFPAQAVVQSQVWLDLPTVLGK